MRSANSNTAFPRTAGAFALAQPSASDVALYGRKDDDLTITVPVTFAEAALGAEIQVPTLAGTPVTVKVPAGTPSGRTLRVKGRGVSTAKATGDLLVTVTVVVPQKLDPVARKAVEAFAEATAGERRNVRADLLARAQE